jgi:hypothetical protein
MQKKKSTSIILKKMQKLKKIKLPAIPVKCLQAKVSKIKFKKGDKIRPHQIPFQICKSGSRRAFHKRYAKCQHEPKVKNGNKTQSQANALT